MILNTLLRSPGLAALVLLLATLPALAQPQKSSQDQLPEMGTAAQAALSLEDENQIGRMVMRNLREAGMVLDDPEVHECIQSLGLRLSSLAQDGNRNFNFFVVREGLRSTSWPRAHAKRSASRPPQGPGTSTPPTRIRRTRPTSWK